jgi:hypothetical protein
MSSKVAMGSIPEKICYVFSDEAEVDVGCRWDIDWRDDTRTNREKVLPAYPIEDSDTKARVRATQWAEQSYYNAPKKVAQFDSVDNKPITNVKILSVQHRSQGGVAYKATIGKYYVDLREDVLMDTLLQAGVGKGGVLLGEYVWAKTSASLKLVRVGSELHKLIMEFESKKNLKPVGKNDLEVGGIYQTRKKEQSVFLGYVNTSVFCTTSGSRGKFDFANSSIKKAMLFYRIYNYNEVKKDHSLLWKEATLHYQFSIKKTHTFIEKAEQLILPDDIIEKIRRRSIKEIKNLILNYTGHIPPKPTYRKLNDDELENYIITYSDHLNMYKHGTSPVELFDVKKFLLFS